MPPSAMAPSPSLAAQPEKKKHTGLWVGIASAGALILIGLVVLIVVLASGNGTPKKTSTPGPRTVSTTTDTVAAEEQGVRDVIIGWKTTEETHDLNRYLSLYSQSFNSGPINLERYRNRTYPEWVQLRSSSFGSQNLPSMQLGNVTVSVKSDQASAVFPSSYQSGGYSSYGTNRLEFRKENGAWKIISEQWQDGTAPPSPFMVSF